jgi:hypothetical protein
MNTAKKLTPAQTRAAKRKAIYRFKIGDRVRVKAHFGGKQENWMKGTIEKVTYKRGFKGSGGNIGYVTVKWDNNHVQIHCQERLLECVNPYLWVFKGALRNPSYHRSKKGPVYWGDDTHQETKIEWVPACGTFIDHACKETEPYGDSGGAHDPCKRCFPNGDPENPDR